MTTVRLERFDSTDGGTFGLINCKGRHFISGELPWRDNQRSKSCIPAGSYTVVWAFSPKFERFTYLLKNVSGRDAIRIHPANFVGSRDAGLRQQVDGCIAIGDGIRYLFDQPFLVNSATSTKDFEKLLGGETFILEIVGRAVGLSE